MLVLLEHYKQNEGINPTQLIKVISPKTHVSHEYSFQTFTFTHLYKFAE